MVRIQGSAVLILFTLNSRALPSYGELLLKLILVGTTGAAFPHCNITLITNRGHTLTAFGLR